MKLREFWERKRNKKKDIFVWFAQKFTKDFKNVYADEQAVNN